MASIRETDRAVLRRLAEEKARIAALPVQEERAGLWLRLNGLERVKPLIWINEIPWHELGIEETLETTDAFCRGLERGLRMTLYQWEHMPGDMIVEDKMCCPLVIRETDFGLREVAETRRTSEQSVLSRAYEPQITDEKDIEKIRAPEVTLDEAATDRNYERMVEIFGGIMPVEKRGAAGSWFAPWDQLITWWGVQEAMTDLVLRPELVKQAMARLVDAWLARLDQYERLNALALNNNNTRIGSGGYGYTDELPRPDFDPAHIRPKDLWGCATAQIFSEVSPDMHKEFALDFEMRWLDRWGLTYYGCCEPLHLKMDVLREIHNLRKVSMSPWIDVEQAAAQMGNSYVFSYKPNPAILAESVWDRDQACAELRVILEKTRGCVVEVILKDISTVMFEPQRLWDWARMAEELTEEFA